MIPLLLKYKLINKGLFYGSVRENESSPPKGRHVQGRMLQYQYLLVVSRILE